MKPFHQLLAVVRVYWPREAAFCNDGCMTIMLVREMHNNQALNGVCRDCCLTLTYHYITTSRLQGRDVNTAAIA